MQDDERPAGGQETHAGGHTGAEGEAQETIGDAIKRGNVPCPVCNQPRAVTSDGDVKRCDNCGDSRFWNLFVTTL